MKSGINFMFVPIVGSLMLFLAILPATFAAFPSIFGRPLFPHLQRPRSPAQSVSQVESSEPQTAAAIARPQFDSGLQNMFLPHVHFMKSPLEALISASQTTDGQSIQALPSLQNAIEQQQPLSSGPLSTQVQPFNPLDWQRRPPIESVQMPIGLQGPQLQAMPLPLPMALQAVPLDTSATVAEVGGQTNDNSQVTNGDIVDKIDAHVAKHLEQTMNEGENPGDAGTSGNANEAGANVGINNDHQQHSYEKPKHQAEHHQAAPTYYSHHHHNVEPHHGHQQHHEHHHEEHHQHHEHHEHHHGTPPEAFEVHHKKGGKSYQYFVQGHEHHR